MESCMRCLEFEAAALRAAGFPLAQTKIEAREATDNSKSFVHSVTIH
jgi:hypothetical protein